MSISTPPSIYFNGTNFNPAFYSIGDEAVSFKFIDANYLRSTNYATSRAAYTQFYGIIYALGGISGDGSQLTNLNASNISSGILSISRGGTGSTTLLSGQILIGNGTSALIQSANLTWNNASNTLSASNFGGSGTGLTALNASNITLGTLTVSQGGTGSTTLLSGQILIGNGTSTLIQSANLTWNNTSNTLSASNFSGSGSAITNLNYNYITLNKPTNFQSDWNSTIINKPTNFQSDWTTTIINKPTNFQSDWTTTIINKPTNFQSDWATTIINKPDLTVYAIKSNVDTSLNTINSTLSN